MWLTEFLGNWESFHKQDGNRSTLTLTSERRGVRPIGFRIRNFPLSTRVFTESWQSPSPKRKPFGARGGLSSHPITTGTGSPDSSGRASPKGPADTERRFLQWIFSTYRHTFHGFHAITKARALLHRSSIPLERNPPMESGSFTPFPVNRISPLTFLQALKSQLRSKKVPFLNRFHPDRFESSKKNSVPGQQQLHCRTKMSSTKSEATFPSVQRTLTLENNFSFPCFLKLKKKHKKGFYVHD